MEFSSHQPEDSLKLLVRSKLVLFIFIMCTICDQASKAVAQWLLSDGVVTSLPGNAIRFCLCFNNGAFYSSGASILPFLHNLFVAWICCVLLAVLFYGLFSRTASLSVVIASAMVFSGGMSNFMDRVFYHGAVIDFININLPFLKTAVFNIADITIMAGFILLSASLMLQRKGGVITVSSLPLSD